MLGVSSAISTAMDLRNILIVLICFTAGISVIWEAYWDKLLDKCGEDPFIMWTFVNTILTSCVYWFFGGIFTIMDLTEKPAATRRLKMQPGRNEPVETRKLKKVIWCVIVNQFLVTFSYNCVFYFAMKNRGFPTLRELPTFHWILFELVVFIIVEEIAVYYCHRLFHHRYIYKHFHKEHHKWTAPIAITANYCHPLEFVCLNLFPPTLGIFILGSHVVIAYLWGIIGTIAILIAHCGYDLPFVPLVVMESHNIHHLEFNKCFGIIGLMDSIHGTYGTYKTTRGKLVKNILKTD